MRPTLFVTLGSAALAGCASLLPAATQQQDSTWQSFHEARSAYDKVQPYKTRLTELQVLGFDPFNSANATVLDNTEILRRFYPSGSAPAGSISPGVADCVEAREHCRGFEVKIRQVHRKRVGNFFLDIFNFRRHTEVTGWEFSAVLLLKGDLVVYKLWNGTPSIHEVEVNRNPLGPLQGIGERSLVR